MESINSLLEWDQETYMPASAHAVRALQIELMATLSHQEITSAAFRKHLSKLVDLETGQILASDLSFHQKRALREWYRTYKMAIALPASFIQDFAKLSSESMIVWAEARKENNFQKFAPFLEKIVSLSQKKAEFLGYQEHPYDALLDAYEPDMTTKQIENLFKKIKKGISSLLLSIASKKEIDNSFLFGKFSAKNILAFSHFLLKSLHYDFSKGRLDLSVHPFSSGLHPFDSRITTRIHNTSLFDPISAVLHEAGHSFYEMGMDASHYGSPLCESISLGIHESQSRFWETRIGQSKPFWKYFFPHLKKFFPKLKNISLDQFYKAINKVQPSFIRVEADEVTYSLHIILRFELEKRLIEGSLTVAELPEAWNASMYAYLGIIPSSDREGCLQDIHWSMGGFGYFPTYTLGNLYAAQFFEIFQQTFPDYEKRLALGDFLFARQWLQENIHQHGKTYSAAELLKNITGKKLTEVPYIHYLEKKYQGIYG